MSAVTDWLADSRALCERAQRHYDEYQGLVGRNGQRTLWQTEEFHDSGADTYSYALKLNRDVLAQLKPVAADIANNLVHSLDQLGSAAARLNGHDRDSAKLYFPWKVVVDAEFEKELRILTKFIGRGFADRIREVRDRHRPWLTQVQAVKTLSTWGKHWALVPSKTSPVAVAVTLPNQGQKIWDVPRDTFQKVDEYTFAVGVPRIVRPFNFVFQLTFEGVDPNVSVSPDSLFNSTFRYVREMIAVNETHYSTAGGA
ncbi:hypothetical protein [Ensifer sp. ENS12]|uniref:hypothetical protein n=1 Tax=Ensifer sp. ENS12 TaxID=2854774 RepID=UPI001C457DFF|nr:hypothetical protein [Ensifer sp. ENS12]MBV7522330.1 hypothetical protein [Ensifer sp. ENS12]